MDERQFKHVSQSLDNIRILLGMLTVKGLEDKEQLIALSKAGFTPREISAITGKRLDAVNKALQRIRKALQ